MVNRRAFLQSATAALGATGLAALPSQLRAQCGLEAPALPDASLYARDEEAYWREIRKQFLLPQDTVYLNVGTVGSSPAPVLQAVFDSYIEIEKMAGVSDPRSAAGRSGRDPTSARLARSGARRAGG